MPHQRPWSEAPAYFFSKIEKTPTCWIWHGWNAGPKHPYGRMSVEGVRYDAHRVSYILFKGPIPEGHEIDHLCGKPDCVNPDHLEAVTPRENGQRGTRAAYLHSHNKTGYRGVTRLKDGRYRANIRVNDRLIGLCETKYPEVAAVAYNVAALRHFGPKFHNLNVVDMG